MSAPQHTSYPPPPEVAPLTRAERFLTLFVPLFLLITVAGIAISISQLNGLWEWVIFVLALPTAWALADVITGITHWALDTYGSEDTPYVGYVLIKPFRMHHDYPTYMVQYDDAPTIANSAAGATPLQLGALYLATLGGWWSVLSMLIMISLFGAVATNLFHKWAHMSEPPRIGQMLQRMHLILTESHHEGHHHAPHKTGYCITNGWMNPVLDAMKFWRGMEFFLGKLGFFPHEHTPSSHLPDPSVDVQH
jgi:hypothetical protein